MAAARVNASQLELEGASKSMITPVTKRVLGALLGSHMYLATALCRHWRKTLRQVGQPGGAMQGGQGRDTISHASGGTLLHQLRQ